jgi:hypothetical protein
MSYHHDQPTPPPDRPVGGAADPGGHAHRAQSEAPFGLPVLAELPELAGLLQRLVDVDRLLAEAIDTMVLLADTGQVEAATGVGLDGWLTLVARRTGADVRMLGCAVRVCRRFPALHKAFAAGRISWAQLRAIALQTDRPPQHDDLALDAELADAIGRCEDAEPDALTQMVRWILAEHTPTVDEPTRPEQFEGFLHLQPRLDGTGGTLYGDLDPAAFALIDATTTPTTPPVAPTRDGFAGPTDPDRSRHAARTLGRHRLTNLLTRLAHHCPDPAGDDHAGRDDTGGDPGDGADDQLPAPTLLLRSELDTLLGHDQRPSQLLTTLAGGSVQLDAATARRLANHGGPLRLIVTDQGRVVGVGRKTAVPPGWLRDAVLAVHDTCTAPGCDRAALTAQIDHAIPWTAGGPTDIANCGPLCAHDNRHKERSGWRATGDPDGTRRWHHPRSGLTTTTHPASLRLRRTITDQRPRVRAGHPPSASGTHGPPRPPPPEQRPPDHPG